MRLLGLRVAASIALFATSVQAQIHQLATTYDGSVLYFASNHTVAGQSSSPHPKIFRWDVERGIHVYLERSVEAISADTTNYFELDSPSVSRDGLTLAFAGRRFCWSCTLGTYTGQANLLTPDGSAQWVSGEYNGRWATEVSGNGQFVIQRKAPYSSPFIPSPEVPTSVGLLRSVRTGQDEQRETGPFDDAEPPAYVGTRQMITNDGAIVRAAKGAGIYFASRRSSRLIATDEPVMAPAVNSLGTTILYESRFQNGKRRRLYTIDVRTGRSTLLFADEAVERIGKADPKRFNPSDFYSPPYSVPSPLFSASLDEAGGTVLALVRESPDRARQWLFLIGSNGTDPRWFAFTSEGYREAVISGDGRVIFASTQSGRLIRVDALTGTVEQLLGRSPWIGDITGASSPGAANRIVGGGFTTESFAPLAGEELPIELGGIRVEYYGQPMPLIKVSPTEIVYQIPWEFEPAEPRYRDVADWYTLRVVAASESKLALPPARRIHRYFKTRFEANGIQHSDGTPVSLADPISPGDAAAAFHRIS